MNLPAYNPASAPAPVVGESRGEAFRVCADPLDPTTQNFAADPRYPCRNFQVYPAGPTNNGVGAFRTDCKTSHFLKDDPIVYPGQQGASHLHLFFGNTSTNFASNLTTFAAVGNSTCGGGILNRTAYWVPATIDQNGNVLTALENQVYYKCGYRGVPCASIQPFPAGLRMIAGSAAATTDQGWFTGFQCKDLGIGGKTFPTCPAGSILVQNITFPQCWNGRDLDSADHKSHMAYPEPGIGCPSSHPVALPEIGYNVWYRVPAGQDSSKWKLSSDRYAGPGGYSNHADWANGWDPAILQTWVKRCLNDNFDCGTGPLGDGRLLGVRP